MRIIKVLLQYFSGFILLLCSLPMMLEGGKGIIGGFFLLLGGLVCFPPSRFFIEKKYNFSLSKPIKYVLVVWAWISIGIFTKPAVPPSQSVVATVSNAGSASQNQISALNKSAESNAAPQPKIQQLITSNATTTHIKQQDSTALKIGSESLFIDENKNTTKSTPKTKSNSQHSSTHGVKGRGGYFVGPRGGCYYYAANSKVYVDHSYCY